MNLVLSGYADLQKVFYVGLDLYWHLCDADIRCNHEKTTVIRVYVFN